MAQHDEQELEDSFTALSYGLTLEQYRDAQRIAAMTPSITQVTRLIALAMKHPPHSLPLVHRAIGRMISS